MTHQRWTFTDDQDTVSVGCGGREYRFVAIGTDNDDSECEALIPPDMAIEFAERVISVARGIKARNQSPAEYIRETNPDIAT